MRPQCRRDRGFPVTGLQGAVTVALDVEPQQLPDLGVVIHEENRCHGPRVYVRGVKAA